MTSSATTTTTIPRATAITSRADLRRLAWLAATVGALTLLGTAAGLVLPDLAPSGRPHAVLQGTAGEALSIFLHNARLLAVPFILVAARWSTGTITRPLGDAITLAILTGNALLVGLALGRHREALVPYLPHLPLEWLALTVAAAAWAAHRNHRATWRSVGSYASLTVTLAALAAIVEAFAVPHV